MNQYYTEKQQTQYVDDAMRKARVQARKAQQTGGVIPSVKGIRESVSQPTVSAAPSTPSTPSVQTTTSVPTVRPPSVTSPALTTPNAAADVPLSTPKPTVSKTYTANVQRANSDILNANKQKATADVWGTDPAPAASPLQTTAPAKAAAVKIKQTDYTKPDAGGILKPQAPVTDVPFSTAPVSNRTALFGAKDTPDLTLTAKKLEQMGDLYREFSPQQRALLDDYYKNDPASLDVIRGRTTGNDWLLAKSRAAQQREQARVEIAAQRRADSLKNSSIKSSMKRGYGVHNYMTDMDGQLILLPDVDSNQPKRTYHYEFDHDGNLMLMQPKEELRLYQRRATLLDPQSIRYPNMPPKDQNGKLVFTVDEWNGFQDRLLSEASRSSDYVLWRRTEEINDAKVSTTKKLLELLDIAAMLAGSGISQGDSLALMLQKLGTAYVEGIDKPSMAMTTNTQWYQKWQEALDEYNNATKLSDFRYFIKNDIAAIEFVQKQQKRLEAVKNQNDFGYDTPLKNEYFKQRLLQEIELSILVNTVERKKAHKSWRNNS